MTGDATGEATAPASLPVSAPGPATAPAVEVNISIINYRTAEMTIRCAASALETLDGIDAWISIVDNASGGGEADRIAAWIAGLPAGSPVSLVRSPLNTGFSGGHNLGMGARAARFHLLFNSDAELRPGALRLLLDAARAHPRAGLVAPRLEWDDGTPQISAFRHHSPLSELIRGAGSGPVTALLGRWNVPLPLDPDPAQVEWVSFACVLLRAEAAAQVGPMDEGYFLYFEDADHCARLAQAGWSIALEPRARVVHHRGGSAPVKSLAAARKRLPAYYYASRTRLMRRLHGRLGPLAANLAWHLGRGLAQLRRLAGKEAPRSNDREAGDIWTNFLDPLGDRRAPDEARRDAAG